MAGMSQKKNYPRTWATLTSNETSFVFMREVGDIWREVLIDTGYYKSERALVNAINKAIDEDIDTISFSQSSKRLKVILPEYCTLHFNEPLSYMVRFGEGNVVCTNAMKRGTFPIDLSRRIDSLYVYSEVVQTRLVGTLLHHF